MKNNGRQVNRQAGRREEQKQVESQQRNRNNATGTE
jgi:hypothetical protein